MMSQKRDSLMRHYISLLPKKLYQTIAMMWKFLMETNPSKRLHIISQLDGNWLISLFKKEYFKIKYQLSLTYQEPYYLSAFIGIDKNFLLYDREKALVIDEVSTVRKRLTTSMANAVPFYIYSNKATFSKEMIEEIKSILFEIF
jgi:hypothetical protein